MKGANRLRDALAILGLALGLSYVKPFTASMLSHLACQFEGLYRPAEPEVEAGIVDPFAAFAATYREACPAHQFTVKLLSRAPDIMIIEDFLTPREAEFLINVAYNSPASHISFYRHFLSGAATPILPIPK